MEKESIVLTGKEAEILRDLCFARNKVLQTDHAQLPEELPLPTVFSVKTARDTKPLFDFYSCVRCGNVEGLKHQKDFRKDLPPETVEKMIVDYRQILNQLMQEKKYEPEDIRNLQNSLLNKQAEPWGKWAGRIYGKSGKWKKASNALGRKITIALYYVHKTGNAFDYDMYRTEEPEVMDIPLEQLVEIEPAFRRYIRKLIPLEIETTQEMVHNYHICAFKKVRGLGKGFYNLVDTFIQKQDYYRNRHYEIYGEENMLYGEEDRDDFNE